MAGGGPRLRDARRDALDLASLSPYLWRMASRYYYRYYTTRLPTFPHVGTPTNELVCAQYNYSPSGDGDVAFGAAPEQTMAD